MRVYLDSCIVIYLVEEHLDYAPRLDTILADLSKDTEIFLQVSDLTELECLVLPLRQKNQSVLDKYRAWFESVEILSLGREVFRRAAQLRADFVSLKTPDEYIWRQLNNMPATSYGQMTTGFTELLLV